MKTPNGIYAEQLRLGNTPKQTDKILQRNYCKKGIHLFRLENFADGIYFTCMACMKSYPCVDYVMKLQRKSAKLSKQLQQVKEGQ